jgi:hypothetical protein
MFKSVIALAVAVALGFVLNPGPEAHREKLKAEIAARNRLAGLLGLNRLAAVASTYHTLGVASYCTLDDRVVSYGAFGIVFIPNLTDR